MSVPGPKKLLMIADIDNYYTSARRCITTLGNFCHPPSSNLPAKATFDIISKTYSYLTPHLWK